MRFHEMNKRYLSFGIISLFRLLLWWGGQAVQRLFVLKQNRPQISRVSKIDSMFPQVVWFCSDSGIGCFVSKIDETEIEIRVLQDLNRN